MLVISAHILDSIWKLRSYRKWDKEMDITTDDDTSYTTQFQEAFVNYVENKCWDKHLRMAIIILTMFQVLISSPAQYVLDLINLRLIPIISPAMMKNTWPVKVWLKQHPEKAIMHHAAWQPQGCSRNGRVKHRRTVGKLIQLLMITTLTPWRLVVHFGYWTSPTGGVNMRKCTQSMQISPMWHATWSQSYYIVLVLRPVFPLGETL